MNNLGNIVDQHYNKYHRPIKMKFIDVKSSIYLSWLWGWK